MSALFGLFNILSLVYVFRGLQIVANIWRNWSSLRQEPLTHAKKRVAENASFFVAVPPSVAFHEFCHALATWAFGGRIIDFGYGVFWGYVVPSGLFSRSQSWFIALAGTLGNLVFGLLLWLWLRRQAASSLRFFGLRAFRFQLHFALIYYPILTIFLPAGSGADWNVIYDFRATPVLSGITAVLHLAALTLFLVADRRGWFEMAGFDSADEQGQFDTLAREAGHYPEDVSRQLQLIDGLRRGGAANQARTALKRLLARHPQSGDAYLQLAALQSQGQSHIGRDSQQNATKALRYGLTTPRSTLFAHQLLGQYHMERDETAVAIDHFSQALATAVGLHDNGPAPRLDEARLRFWRSQAYRRQRQYDLAYQDLQRSITLADAADAAQLAAAGRDELAILEKHSGRLFGSRTP